MGFEDDLLAYMKELDAKKPVVLTGDLNVAHEEIDIKNPQANVHNAGFTLEERAKFTASIKRRLRRYLSCSLYPSKRSNTLGGVTASTPEPITLAGASTTSWSQARLMDRWHRFQDP
jgi:hypothetical protein